MPAGSKSVEIYPFSKHAYTNPLEEPARRDRRMVLAIGILALFVAATRSVPSQISTFGIDLRGNEQTVIGFLFVVLAYFMVSFLHRARGDKKLWELHHTEARWTRQATLSSITSAGDDYILSQLTNVSTRDTMVKRQGLTEEFAQVRKAVGDDETSVVPVFQWMKDVTEKAVPLRKSFASEGSQTRAKQKFINENFAEERDRFAGLSTQQPSTKLYRRMTLLLSWWLPVVIGGLGLFSLFVLFLFPSETPASPQPSFRALPWRVR